MLICIDDDDIAVVGSIDYRLHKKIGIIMDLNDYEALVELKPSKTQSGGSNNDNDDDDYSFMFPAGCYNSNLQQNSGGLSPFGTSSYMPRSIHPVTQKPERVTVPVFSLCLEDRTLYSRMEQERIEQQQIAFSSPQPHDRLRHLSSNDSKIGRASCRERVL